MIRLQVSKTCLRNTFIANKSGEKIENIMEYNVRE